MSFCAVVISRLAGENCKLRLSLYKLSLNLYKLRLCLCVLRLCLQLWGGICYLRMWFGEGCRGGWRIFIGVWTFN